LFNYSAKSIKIHRDAEKLFIRDMREEFRKNIITPWMSRRYGRNRPNVNNIRRQAEDFWCDTTLYGSTSHG